KVMLPFLFLLDIVTAEPYCSFSCRSCCCINLGFLVVCGLSLIDFLSSVFSFTYCSNVRTLQDSRYACLAMLFIFCLSFIFNIVLLCSSVSFLSLIDFLSSVFLFTYCSNVRTLQDSR